MQNALLEIIVISGDKMKQKKLLLVFCTVLVFLIGLGSVSAKTVCEYKQKNTGRTVELIFGSGDDVSVIINGEEVYVDVNVSSKTKCPTKIYTSLSNNDVYDAKTNPNSNAPVLQLVDSSTNKVYCGEGEGSFTGIPKKIPELTSLAITIIQIAIPVILVIMGSLDLFKGITAGKEDEIKKGQQMFIKRLVTGAIIFFVVVIIKFLISIVADTNVTNMVDCIDCFISNSCKEDFSL